MYPDERVERYIGEHFLPVKIHVKEQPKNFARFGAQWTPTTIVLDPKGVERHRWEGFLPVQEFLAQLALGRAKVAFAENRFDEAAKLYDQTVREFGDTESAPEAMYWAGVSRYKDSNDPAALSEAARQFQQKYQGSVWAKKASVWAGH